VKLDGTCEGESQSVGVALTTLRDGKWKITGDTVTFNHRADEVLGGGSRGGRVLTNSTWTLKRAGESLDGNGVTNSVIVVQYSMKLNKAK
jgi:hypothetical protein